jgi:3',5'-nucleoside bisphosphate phosphatase
MNTWCIIRFISRFISISGGIDKAMSWLDFHLHSNISSDGELSPAEIIRLCSKSTVKAASLTDHNSVRGNAEAAHEAKKLGITFFTGIEMDCHINGVDLHLLGYGIDPQYEPFQRIEQQVEEHDRLASARQMDSVAQLGIHFCQELVMQLAKNGVVTPEMIAEVALQDERNKNHPLMMPFYPGGERSDNPYVNFYWDICSAGKPAYIPTEHINLAEAIQTIHAAGGIPVLAHPGNNIGTNHEILQQIVDHGIAGIEVFSSYHKPPITDFYKAQADHFHLLKTVGSDFHGKTKPAILPGSVACDNHENEILQTLMDQLA